jgi:hypothetical protein
MVLEILLCRTYFIDKDKYGTLLNGFVGIVNGKGDEEGLIFELDLLEILLAQTGNVN